jgi:hypothetical protein
MALWYGEKGEAFAFIYRRGNLYPSIVCRGTWALHLPPRVVEVWQEVASSLNGKLQVDLEKVDGYIYGHGDAIYHLELPIEVVHSLSLKQMRSEGRRSVI